MGVSGVDVELKEYLEAFRQEIFCRLGRVENRLDERTTKEVTALREDVQGVDRSLRAELRGVEGALREEMRMEIQGVRVLVEDLQDQVRIVADGVAMISETLDCRLAERDRDNERRLELHEAALKNHSAEIADLKNRVAVLENRDG